MRVAFVAQPFDTMYPPVVRGGSLALWIYYMARLSAKRGHQTFVFGNDGGLMFARSTESDNVRYIFVPTLFNRLLNKALKSALAARPEMLNGSRPLFASPWYHWVYAAQIGHRARQLGCDVIHIMNYSQFVPVIRRAHPRCTISLHMQCEWLTQLRRDLVAKWLEQTDIIIGCSEYITGKIRERFPEYANRCITVPNAADDTASEGDAYSDTKTVLCVNRLSPEKGIHDLIQAFHQVLERFPDARLHLVGGIGSVPFEFVVGLSDDPLVAALHVFYEKKGSSTKDSYFEFLEKSAGQELGKRIIFEGHLAHDQTGGYYRRAAVLVSSSLSEPFGISLVEAMMQRRPVVATRVGGIPYIVDDGRTGFLADPADPNALANAICDVLNDPARSRQMGEAGRKRALENFSWERTADLLLERFQSSTEHPQISNVTQPQSKTPHKGFHKVRRKAAPHG
jgi:spore coat protein SA